MKIRYLCILCFAWCLAFFPNFTWAQAPTPVAKVLIGGAISSNLSYTGLGITGGVSFRKNNLALIVGPRLSLTDTYRLASGPWGGSAGLYYYTTFSATRRLQGFANIDYQNLFQRPYCPTGDCGRQRNTTHELSLGYGLSYSLTTRLAVFNGINVGLYRESLHNQFRNEQLPVQGLNMLIKLGLHYSFSDEN